MGKVTNKSNRYIVLGGAGAMGRITVRDLVETCPAQDEVVIADYDIQKATALAEEYKTIRKSGRCKISALFVDLKDRASLDSALTGGFVVINSAPYAYNLEVMEAALRTKIHYVDLGGLFHMTVKQQKLNAEFKKINRTAVLGMGAAPGITNILARFGAEKLDSVEEIHMRVAGVDNTRYEPKPTLPVSYTLATILEEFSFKPAVFTKGKMTFVEPMSGDKPHPFPNPVGKQKPMYTIHSEVATIPESFTDMGVKEVSFKIAFDPEFTERVRFLRDLGFGSHEPINVAGKEIRPIDATNKIVMSQPASKVVGKVKQHEVVRAIVKGMSGKNKKTFILDCHTKGMPEWGIGLDIDTGTPPAIAAQMLALGEINQAGALPPEKCVPPKAFIGHLKARKMQVKVTEKPGWAFPT
jgi:saccharopine dehydrogenase-like NADP-dependent oxidoreductase